MDFKALAERKVERKWLWLFVSIALLTLAVMYIKTGFGIWSFGVLVLWIVFFVLWWIGKIVKFLFVTIFVLSVLVVTAIGMIAARGTGIKAPRGIELTECTSKLATQPNIIDGWKVSMFAGVLQETTPNMDPSNQTRTFSLQGITGKTEKNTFYVRLEKSDGGVITGFDTGMEVCDENNKTSVTYSIRNHDQSDVAGANVVARTHYFHGGPYIAHTGKHRVDAYVKDQSGKWHLVARTEGITITE